MDLRLGACFALALLAFEAEAATVVSKNLEKQTIVVQLDADELPECCKRNSSLKITGPKATFGTYKVVGMKRKLRQVNLRVDNDIAKFSKNQKIQASIAGSGGESVAGSTSAPTDGLNRSENVRAAKSVGALVGGGLVVGSIAGPSFDLFYNLGPRFQAAFNYAMGRTTRDFSDSEFESTGVIDASIMAGRMRWFVSNNFNVSALIGMRTVNFSASISSKTSVNELHMDVATNSVVAGLTIGNHWTFASGLTIGCDWVGYYMPLSSQSDTAVETVGDISTSQETFAADVEESGKRLGNTANDQGLIATIGWVF